MKYCKKCLNTDTRPGTVFSKDGKCPVCSYNEKKGYIDWNHRRKILDDIVAFGKENASGTYDCIIGVSGGKDSTRQAIFVKETLKMNPLLVCLEYPPEQVTQIGVNNLSNLIELGFDCITIYPDPKIWKKLVKKGFFEFGNYLKACEIALFSSVPRLAIAYQIPLIWWGENSAIQLGETSVSGKTEYDGNNLRNMNTLGGGDINWMLGDGITKKDLLQFTYPSQSDIEKANIRITFLGYFWEDWSAINNGFYGALQGIEFRENKPWETGDLYGISALDDDWIGFNQGIKYLKFGFGRVNDLVNEEIRNGLMTREEGIALVEKYDGMFNVKFVHNFCKYIDITHDEFWQRIDKFVNPLLFNKIKQGEYKRKFKVGIGL
ncbi:N-acetyl sugar amidotransferase [Flavobacteriaceae bacterium]|nr:N-acetyl sugar amidotransferase [Flavobacteriaceae bacterium]